MSFLKRKVPQPKSLSIHIHSDIHELKKVEKFAGSVWEKVIGRQVANEQDRLQEYFIKLALHETCLNIMRHAYNNDPTKEIRIESRIFSDKVEFYVKDRGKRFDYITGAELGFTEQPKESGYGLPLITALMDKIDYQSNWLKGNVFKLTKKIDTFCRDVHEMLAISEHSYCELVESLPDALFETDLDGNFIYANPKAFEISGYTRQDFDRGLNVFDMVVPDERERARQNMRKILSGEKSKGNTYTVMRKNGEKYPVIIHSSPIIREGKAVGLRGIFTDISEIREAEAALIESQEKLKGIFDSSPNAITVTDLNGNIIECNQRTLELSGFSSKEEIIGQNAFNFIFESDRAQAGENLKKTIETGIIKNVEYTFIKKDGATYPGELSASLLRDNTGKPIGFIAIISDITKRKKALETIIIRNKAIDSAVNAILMMDLNGEITYVNQAFLDKWGYENKEEVIGQLGDKFWEASAAKREEIAHAMAELGNWIGEIKAVRKDGSTFPVYLYLSYVRDEKNKPIRMLCSLIDISERKQIENAAAEIQRSLLPAEELQWENLEIKWKFIPSENIGGDIFNYFFLNDENIAIYMADVCGHGIPSAMISVSISQALMPQTGYLIKNNKLLSPLEVIQTMDRDFPIKRFGRQFALCYIVINTKTGHLSYSNAAFPPPVIYRKSGEIEYLNKGGSFIGLGDLVPFEEGEIKLNSGDKLFICSDGMLDCQNQEGVIFGQKRMVEALDKVKGYNVQKMLDYLIGRLMDFSKQPGPWDDISIIGIEYKK